MNPHQLEALQNVHAKGLKMHLRIVDVHGTTFRVATLRASTRVRFSTNYFHDTWHILTDGEGARLFARLLWALSFQRAPGTCVLIDAPHMTSTPFEADPALPVLLMRDDLASADPDRLRFLRARLRERADGGGRHADGAPNSMTIRFHTFGMPENVRAWHDARIPPARHYEDEKLLFAREKMSRISGFIVYSAPAEILREHALSIHHMRGGKYADYLYLAEGVRARWSHSPPGEIQVFQHFKDMVSAAKVARHEIIGTEADSRMMADADEQFRVHRRAEHARARLVRARRPSSA